MVRAEHELPLSVKKLARQTVFLALFLSFPLTVHGAILSCNLKGVTDSDDGRIVFDKKLKVVDLAWFTSGAGRNSVKAEDGQKKYFLLPNKKMIFSFWNNSAAARYSCDLSPAELVSKPVRSPMPIVKKQYANPPLKLCHGESRFWNNCVGQTAVSYTHLTLPTIHLV